MGYSQCVEQTASTVFQKYYGLFEPVFRDSMRGFLARAEKCLNKAGDLIPDQGHILESLASDTVCALRMLTVRPMIAFLLEHKDELIGETPEIRYADFIRRFVDGHFEELFPAGSEMRWLIDHRYELTLNAFSEMIDRLLKDRELIRESLGMEVQSLDDISMSLGDTHGGGRSVCILTVNQEDKLVYKPHSVYNDLIFDRTIRWFMSRGILKDELHHIPTLDCGDYGWQSFVKNEPCEDEKQAKQYMYRMGVMLLISYVLSFSDLHVENMIAQGAYPIAIDTETLLTNHSGFGGKILEENDGWSNMLMDSVFSSLLLPMELLSGLEKKEDVDFSGILGGINKLKYNGLHLTNFGRDDLCFQDGEYTDANDERLGNIARLQGESLRPSDYLDQILKGFDDGYCTIMQNKESFLHFIDEAEFNRGIYRQVLRNTSLYGKYLEATHHPNYAKDRETRAAVFSRLKGKRGYINKFHESVVASEIEQLLNDEIPFFSTKFDSLDLYPPYGEPICGFYTKTLREQLVEKVEILSEKDKKRQMFFVRSALTEKVFKAGNTSVWQVEKDAVVGETVREQAASLARYLFRVHEEQRVFDRSGKVAGYCNNNIFNDEVRIYPEPGTLYHGAGSALFYLQMNRLFGDEYRAPAQEILKCMLPDLDQDSFKEKKDEQWIVDDFGLFSVYISAAYLDLQVYRLWKDEAYRRQLFKVCDLILKAKRPEKDNEDVIAGYSGSIIFFLRAWEQDPSIGVLKDIALKLGSWLLDMFQKGAIRVQTGLAHGYAGPILALFMLAKATGEEAYYMAAVELLHRERRFFNEEENGWVDNRSGRTGMEMWCYGSGGILVSRLLSMKYARESEHAILEEDISRCLFLLMENVAENFFPSILCHGSAGNLDVLLWYLSQREDKTVRSFVDEKTAALLDQIRTRGIITEQAEGLFDISFMLGGTGLGYYMLRYLDPSIPSVLALETL